MKIYRILKLSPTLLTLLLCLLIAGTALAAGEQLRQGAFTGGGGPMQANNIALHSSIGQFASRTVQTGSLSLCSGILCGGAAASAPVEDAPISGLTATNSGPTTPGNVVSLVASISSGSNVAYAWDFGDGSSGSGVTASHTYAVNGDYTVTLTVTDNGGATSSTSQNVSVANNPPIASFTVSCTDLGCNFDASGSTDADGSITAYAWDFGDGSSGSGVTASHTYAAEGDYTVTLTVTDEAGATATASQTVTVSQGSGGGSLHLGALSGNGVPPSKGKNWTANVVITIHDAAHAPVANATVSGTWSNGVNGSDSCLTDGNGQCTISKGVKSNVAAVTFTVDSVTHGTLGYDSGLNDVSNVVAVSRP